jgi:hypothetical protein
MFSEKIIYHLFFIFHEGIYTRVYEYLDFIEENVWPGDEVEI